MSDFDLREWPQEVGLLGNYHKVVKNVQELLLKPTVTKDRTNKAVMKKSAACLKRPASKMGQEAFIDSSDSD